VFGIDEYKKTLIVYGGQCIGDWFVVGGTCNGAISNRRIPKRNAQFFNEHGIAIFRLDANGAACQRTIILHFPYLKPVSTVGGHEPSAL